MNRYHRTPAREDAFTVSFAVRCVEIPENYRVDWGHDEGRLYVQVSSYRRDVVTGEMGWGDGGKRYLPHNVHCDTVVKTVWGAYLAYVEHEARETFLFKGKRIFGPHISLDALTTVADNIV